MEGATARGYARLIAHEGTRLVMDSSVAVPVAMSLGGAEGGAGGGYVSVDPSHVDAIARYVSSPGAAGRARLTKTARAELSRLARKAAFRRGAEKLLRTVDASGFTRIREHNRIVRRIYLSEEAVPTARWAARKREAVAREFGPDAVGRIGRSTGFRMKVRSYLARGSRNDIRIVSEAVSLAAQHDVVLVARDSDFVLFRDALYRKIRELRDGGARMNRVAVLLPSEFVAALGAMEI